VLPLALAQFICSYAGSNMNVAISTIADDLGTTVTGIQTTITLFTLTMAALMIPGSKLTDIWGRKVCFIAGLVVYGAGALLASFANSLTMLRIGYSLLEGVGSALLIPPIYIMVTVLFNDIATRAKYFGVVSGAGGVGATAGPLIGGLITSYISWRASFLVQVLVVGAIARCSRGGSSTRPCRRNGRASTYSAPSCRRSACSSSSTASCRPGRTAGSPPGRTSPSRAPW
jgi:MFS family permease